MILAIRGECQVDVREQEDEVIVAADLPGVEKETVTLSLREPAGS
jgi:HSP20 family protein